MCFFTVLNFNRHLDSSSNERPDISSIQRRIKVMLTIWSGWFSFCPLIKPSLFQFFSMMLEWSILQWPYQKAVLQDVGHEMSEKKELGGSWKAMAAFTHWFWLCMIYDLMPRLYTHPIMCKPVLRKNNCRKTLQEHESVRYIDKIMVCASEKK